MLFQPVVVNDLLAADQSPPAEVRIAERRAHEPPSWQPEWPEWNGALLAQSSMDQRSPFGANAPDNNNLTPQRVPANRPGEQAPASLPATDNGDRSGSTDDTKASSATPSPTQSDTTPPKSLEPDSTTTGTTGTGATRSTTRSANTPVVTRPDQSVSPTPGSVTPGTERSTSTPIRGATGATGATGTTSTPMPGSTASPTTPAPASSAPLYPGASSGASNSQ